MSRPSLRIAGLLLLLLLAAACAPSASIAVRQSLRPAPAFDCVAAALAASPRVVMVMPSKPTPTEGHFGVILRDSLARGGPTVANVTYFVGWGAGQDSLSAVEVKFAWTAQPGDEEKRHRASLGRALLAELRAACAPDATGSVECVEQGAGRDRSRGCAAV
jgi:hypothetical protein